MNLTTEQMQAILDGAPSGAEYCWFDFSDSNDVWYYKDEGNQAWGKNGWGFCNDPQFPKKLDERLIKLSDIRAELNEREDKRLAQEVKDKLDALTYYPKVCLSNIAKNDTQSELKPCPFCSEKPELPTNDSIGTWYDIECECGKAKAFVQVCDLMTIDERDQSISPSNQYPQQYIDRAKAHVINQWNTRAEQSIQAYFNSDERGSIEQEQSVIEPTHMKCALLRDSSLEKLQWLINESLANGWTLVGAVVSAGIHNDTFVATIMKVAGDE